MDTKKTDDIVEKKMAGSVVDTAGDPTMNSGEQGMGSEQREKERYGIQKKSPDHPDLENLIPEPNEVQGSTQAENIAWIRDDRVTTTGPKDRGDNAVHDECAQLTGNFPEKKRPNYPHREGESPGFGDEDLVMSAERGGIQASPMRTRLLDSHVLGQRKMSEKAHEPPPVADIMAVTSCVQRSTTLDGPRDSMSVQVVKAGLCVANREHPKMKTSGAILIPASDDDEATSFVQREARSAGSLSLPLARALSKDPGLEDMVATPTQVVDYPGRHGQSSPSPQHLPGPSNQLSQFEGCSAPPANRTPQRSGLVGSSELTDGTDMAKRFRSKSNQEESRPASDSEDQRRHQAAIKIQAHARRRVASKRLATMRLGNAKGDGTMAVDRKKSNRALKVMSVSCSEKSQTVQTKQHVPGLCIASSTVPQSTAGAAKRVAQEPLAILRQLRDHPGSKPRAEESEFRLQATVRSAIDAHVRKTGAMRRKARPLPIFPDWSLNSTSQATTTGPNLRGVRALPRKNRAALLPQQHNQQGRLLAAISSMNKRRPLTSGTSAISGAQVTRLPKALAAP